LNDDRVLLKHHLQSGFRVVIDFPEAGDGGEKEVFDAGPDPYVYVRCGYAGAGVCCDLFGLLGCFFDRTPAPANDSAVALPIPLASIRSVKLLFLFAVPLLWYHGSILPDLMITAVLVKSKMLILN
jgi:hypothetical protein